MASIKSGRDARIRSTSWGSTSITALIKAVAPLITWGRREDTSWGITAASFGASWVTRLATPSSTVLIRGSRLSPTVIKLLKKLFSRVSKSWLSSVRPVRRLVQEAFRAEKLPWMVVLASVAVVPVMPISLCTTWMAWMIWSKLTWLTVSAVTVMESPSTPESLISLAISAWVPP